MIPKHTLDFIDSWLELTTMWEETTGLAVSIMHKGKLVFDKTYGMANVEEKIPLTKDYLYRVASQSKVFTATAVMQLQEKGKLRIDDLAITYLPWLKNHKDERWKTVTIRQLLSHSAGVMRDGESSGFWSLQAPFLNESELKKEILASDLVLEPNTKLKYSNIGYGILGMIIQQVSGKSYGEYVKKHIIDELGLSSTAPDIDKDLKMATGYSRRNLERKRFAFSQVATNALAPATGFCSKPSDLCVFFNALKIGSGKLLSDTSKREMQRKQWDIAKEDDSYGLGMDIGERSGHRLVGHSGGFPGFGSWTWLDGENDVVVSVVVTEHGTWTGPIISSIFAIFSEFGDEPPKVELMKYEGRFAGLHGAVEIVAHAGGLRRIYPNGWWPMDEVDKLRIVTKTTLELYDTSGFDGEGEKVVFQFNTDGSPKSIAISGDELPVSDDANLKPWW